KDEAQVLDFLQVEKERGITVKAQTATMFYRYREQRMRRRAERYFDKFVSLSSDPQSLLQCLEDSAEETSADEDNVEKDSEYADYVLNLIDTPGHVDFSYEVARALATCDGVLLLVDASQGVQAQTLAHFHTARRLGLKIIP